jgi:flagellar motor switch/type III secretory pathway protein FliN
LGAAAGAPPGRELAPIPPAAEGERPSAFGNAVVRLPVQLDVVIPVRDLRVRHLLALASGHVIESEWANGEDVPLNAGAVHLAWGEFEVIGTQLAIRVTRLA